MSVVWREDPLLGNTVDGVCPAGSDEAWAAVLRVRRMLFGGDVTTEPIIVNRGPNEVKKVECLYCLRYFLRTAPGQIWCATCDKQIQANKARAWNQARRTRANQVEGRRLERIAGKRA